jgi:hypothetical protein
LATHLPDSRVFVLSPDEIESADCFSRLLQKQLDLYSKAELLIGIVDQYEETVAERANLPSQFVERLSLLDRGDLRNHPMLFLWLTTNKDFQASLATATSRNERILVSSEFELFGPDRDTWPQIIEETCRFHNDDRPIADFQILQNDLEDISKASITATIGQAIEKVGHRLFAYAPSLQDLSEYQVLMLWPVTDGLRISRVTQFTSPRDGYRLDWNSWYREFNAEDRTQLPLHQLNRARLYFDMRLIPIAAADLQGICRELDNENPEIAQSYMDRLQKSHFVSILNDQWSPDSYSPLRERESERAERARDWWGTVTSEPTKIARRLAFCLRQLGLDAQHEKEIRTPQGSVRADVLVIRLAGKQRKVIIELKAFSADNTMPSSIRDAIRVTLKRHAQLAGFLPRQ